MQNNEAKNPLQIMFYVLMFEGVSALYGMLNGGGVLARKYDYLTAYSQQIVQLLAVSCFILFYQRRSILAWWMPC